MAAALASGRMLGVGITDTQLQVARDPAQFHADAFFGEGSKTNTDFRKGFIKGLSSAAVRDGEIDLVTSNCACNVSTDKKAVFSEVGYCDIMVRYTSRTCTRIGGCQRGRGSTPHW